MTEEMQALQSKNLANERGGTCLSSSYHNRRTPLSWRCSEGHSWFARIDSIQRGTWCSHCVRESARLGIEYAKKIACSKDGECLSNVYKRERLCQEIMSKYLGPPSKIRRPDFLKTLDHPTGLELDIYYPQYGFATEVQGEQHEKYIEFFHRGDPNNFIKQQARDQLKKELCEENCIALRYVWYYEDPYVVIPEHLRELGLID
ncbi:16110_t:CDS:2 [Funneliformis geosporum]|nr:16110_t:CDS:2 [Funneliformis geosporum]